MRVLVVEDDPVLAELVAEGLRHDGIAVDVVLDGGAALERTAVNHYDVVVLDRQIPVVHGDDVCRSLIAEPEAPKILMLTAADAEREEVHGLSIGADDYLAKPVSLSVLSARVRALSRRASAARPPVLTHGDLIIDTARRFAARGGIPLALSRKELAVLEALLETVWDESIDPFTNTVRVTIMKLRRKLGEPPLIVTLPGEGYRL